MRIICASFKLRGSSECAGLEGPAFAFAFAFVFVFGFVVAFAFEAVRAAGAPMSSLSTSILFGFQVERDESLMVEILGGHGVMKKESRL